MKYYTIQLWSKAGDPEADIKWKTSVEAYSKIFDEVKKRLPDKFLNVYLNNAGFHDSNIMSVNLKQDSYGKDIDVVNIDIKVPDEEVSYRISYRYPIKFEVKYQKEYPCNGFDDWGYDEFLPVDKEMLSHEILFASGATILIHFKDKDISVEKLDTEEMIK